MKYLQTKYNISPHNFITPPTKTLYMQTEFWVKGLPLRKMLVIYSELFQIFNNIKASI